VPHRATLELEPLVARLGEDYIIAALIERSVCGECGTGWLDLSLTLHPRQVPRVVVPPEKPPAPKAG
jgi:hypothetical protein